MPAGGGEDSEPLGQPLLHARSHTRSHTHAHAVTHAVTQEPHAQSHLPTHARTHTRAHTQRGREREGESRDLPESRLVDAAEHSGAAFVRLHPATLGEPVLPALRHRLHSGLHCGVLPVIPMAEEIDLPQTTVSERVRPRDRESDRQSGRAAERQRAEGTRLCHVESLRGVP